MRKDIEIRKVQQVGQSTLTVSLPKYWVNRVGLKRGDVVVFVTDDDGSLKLFTNSMVSEFSEPECLVEVKAFKKKGTLSRAIIAAYEIGYDRIKIVSDKTLTKEQIKEVRSAVEELVGVGVIEQGLNYMLVQAMVDPTKFPLEGLKKRISTLISSMLLMIMKLVRGEGEDSIEEISYVKEELDKLCRLAIRQVFLASECRVVARKIGAGYVTNLIEDRMVIGILQKVGATLLNLALLLSKEPTTRRKSRTPIFDVLSRILKGTLELIESPNIEATSEIITEAEKRISELHAEGEKLKGAHSNGIAWLIRQLFDYCTLICEVMANRCMEEFAPSCMVRRIRLT